MRKLQGIFSLVIILAAACSRPTAVPDAETTEAYVHVSGSLSNQWINAFAEDTDGHIWIGTDRGLNKYSIHEYHQYFHTPDSLSPPDNRITALRCSSSGQLWIGTSNGAAVRTDDGRFRRIPALGGFKSIGDILETRDGQLLFVSEGSLLRYDAQEDCLRPVIREFGGFNTMITQDGRIWTFNSLTEMRCFNGKDFQPAGSWRTLHEAYHTTIASSGEIWISGMGRISIFDPHTGTWRNVPESILKEKRLSGGDVDYLFTDGPQILLNTISDGMFCYNQATGKLLHESDPDFPYTVPDFEFRTIFRDSRGNLWFGGIDQGYSVSYAARDGFNENRFLTDYFDHKSVVSLCPDRDGHLWIATHNDGLYVYGPGSKELRKIDLNPFVPDNNVGYIRCSSVFCDAEGEMWLVLTDKHRVLRCRYDDRQLRQLDQIWQYNPVCLSQDDLGHVWISGYAGEIIRYDKATRRTERIPAPDGKQHFIPTMLQIAPGRMAVLTYGTLPFEVLTNTSETHYLDFYDTAATSFFGNAELRPTCLFQDSIGDIWVGTSSNGLLHFSRAEGTFSQVDGAPCLDISAIQEDLQGNIWVSTKNGLGRYDRTVGVFFNFFEDDGIGGNQFYNRSTCILQDGTVIFGGTHGLTSFNPLDIRRKRNAPLVFEDLKIHNQLVMPGPEAPIGQELVQQPKVTLRDDENGFSISYAALDYSDYTRPRYAYMMEGFDRYWVEAGTVNEANYANLPAGRYRFRVMVQDDPASEQSLDIRILPPWYRSWWASILYALLGMGFTLLVFYFYRRIHRVRKQAAQHIREVRREQERAEQEREAEKRLNSTQMNYFSNIAHEFRTPLTMIAGPVDQLVRSNGIQGEDRKLLEIVQRSSAWMLSLVGQLLDFNRISNNKLSIKVVKDDIVEPLRSAAALFRFNA